MPPPRLFPPLRPSSTTRPPVLPQRPFTSTPHPRQKLTPESPKFIEIPEPPRTPRLFKPPLKGKLPTPKIIFPSVGPDKTSAEYLALVTPEPTKPKIPPRGKPHDEAYIQWKAKMAQHRRRNLREGIVELAEKKKEFDDLRTRVLKKRAERRQELLDRKERDDVRLTLPSVLSTLKQPERFSDPNREERISAQKDLLKKRVSDKTEERREMLHNLYLNSASFLLTDKQLDMAIEAEFNQPLMSKTLPLTVTEMLAQKARAPTMLNFGGGIARESELIQEAAAALTGGKLAKGNFRGQEDGSEHRFKV